MPRRTNKILPIMLIAALLMFAAHPADAADGRTFAKAGGIAGGTMAAAGTTTAAIGTAAVPTVIVTGGAIIIGFGVGWLVGKAINTWWRGR